MSTMQTGSATAAELSPPKPKTHGFLRIARHGAGPGSMYVITYHRLETVEASRARPVAAESAQELIELLERIGVDFRLREVRGAMEDILRFGSANIPGLWLSDEEMIEKGLVEG
jgi:hypothetical protein